MQAFDYQQACDWINAITRLVPEPLKNYFDIHKIRYMNTFQALRHLEAGAQPESVLDLAGSGMFTGLAKQYLGASSLYFTHFLENDRRTESADDNLARHMLPLDETATGHRAVSWNFNGGTASAEDGKFDLIFALEVIEHITTDPAHFVRQLRRLLSPKGTLILTTPNICSLSALERLISHQNPISYPYFKKDRSADRHNIEYSVPQLRSLLEQSGLLVTHAYTANSWSVPSLALINFCYHSGISLDDRGDNIIMVCKRGSKDAMEFPDGLYD